MPLVNNQPMDQPQLGVFFRHGSIKQQYSEETVDSEIRMAQRRKLPVLSNICNTCSQLFCYEMPVVIHIADHSSDFTRKDSVRSMEKLMKTCLVGRWWQPMSHRTPFKCVVQTGWLEILGLSFQLLPARQVSQFIEWLVLLTWDY